ncbi:trypsin-like serine peptidase [Sedimentitalea todarodis]|uniref:Serine protease n=1 Tax=Sedimentitalea todarodis TaxID=1631240 RepID=A0ABU3VE97_9RHOB|nr:trypsin-like serine protease [Sedimentitalea todarodis]MDU9004494.1 trypsin-like serine protease [Sedimentitalea todarodis]
MELNLLSESLEDDIMSPSDENSGDAGAGDAGTNTESLISEAEPGENFDTEAGAGSNEEVGDDTLSHEVLGGETLPEASDTALKELPEATEDAARDFEDIIGDAEGWETEFGAQRSDSAESGEEAGDDAEFLPNVGDASELGEPEFIGSLIGAVLPTIASATPKLLSLIKRKTSRRKRKKGIRRGNQSKSQLMRLLAQILARIENAPEFDDGGAEAYGDASPAEHAAAEELGRVLEVIIGTDDRIRITNTTRQPWPRTVALRINMGGRFFVGSGSIVSPDTILTAGHCVYMRSSKYGNRWAKDIEVIPGSDGQTRPFGSVKARSFRSVKGWVSQGKAEYDYGCIKLPSNAFAGKRLGHFGYAALPDSELLARRIVLAGYPGDKPFAQLWGMARRLSRVSSRQLFYQHDTYGGQSGSGPYVMRNGRRYIVGIHNYGARTGNIATRITPAVYRNIKAWTEQ